MGSSFIHLIRTDSNVFFLMAVFLFILFNIPLCICTTAFLSIHLLMGIYARTSVALLKIPSVFSLDNETPLSLVSIRLKRSVSLFFQGNSLDPSTGSGSSTS